VSDCLHVIIFYVCGTVDKTVSSPHLVQDRLVAWLLAYSLLWIIL